MSGFLSLPYDIRYLIYRYAFPPGQQIYLQAGRDRLTAISPQRHIPASLLSTCHQLEQEVGEFLYNTYLFNIVGRKQDCLDRYEGFRATVQKYARDDMSVHALSNGSHSATCCVSIHNGTGKGDLVKRRDRGVPTSFAQLRHDIRHRERDMSHPLRPPRMRWSPRPATLRRGLAVAFAVLFWALASWVMRRSTKIAACS